MVKDKDAFNERRRYVRLKTPINIAYTIPNGATIHNITTEDISADGLRFQTRDKKLDEEAVVELRLDIPLASNPVHAKGRIVWKKKISLEDKAPFDVGIEFAEIEEDNKNTFLKFLCDLIYNLSKEV